VGGVGLGGLRRQSLNHPGPAAPAWRAVRG
jgi:hypothetical protein